jgi:hypothetical protein
MSADLPINSGFDRSATAIQYQGGWGSLLLRQERVAGPRCPPLSSTGTRASVGSPRTSELLATNALSPPCPPSPRFHWRHGDFPQAAAARPYSRVQARTTHTSGTSPFSRVRLCIRLSFPRYAAGVVTAPSQDTARLIRPLRVQPSRPLARESSIQHNQRFANR